MLTATAVVAAIGDPAAFRSGREFAAWLGLVPRHEGILDRLVHGAVRIELNGTSMRIDDASNGTSP